MTSMTDRYSGSWCRDNPERAATLIQHYENEWANCSQHCAKLQSERDAAKAERDQFAKDWGECVRGHERYYRAGYQDGFAECTNGGEYSPDEAWACEQERDDE